MPTITKWVEFNGREIEIHVSLEDITNAIEECPEGDRVRDTLLFINRTAGALKGVPTDVIKEMNPAQRKVVGDFLNEEAARYINQNLIEDLS